jgi:hypothetical protein
MATKTVTSRENLLGAAKQTHNNEIMDVAEVLNETNDIIEDMLVQRGNDITSHVVSRRTRLPAVSWVKVGNGWNATVGLTAQAREEMGMLKARYSCPQDVMDLQPNPAKYRANQERAYIESMGQELSNTLMGNVASGALSPTTAPPEEFAGFQYRLASLSTDETKYCISNGSTESSYAKNTSIYFVQHREDGVYLVYPRNMEGGGLKKMDKGLQLVSGDNSVAIDGAVAGQPNPSNQLWAYLSEFSWNTGLCVEDGRCVKRLCNIDSVAGQTNTLDEDKIIQIRNNFKGSTVPYMYCNETVFTQLQILAKDKTNVHWTEQNPFGKPQMYFLDMPVRRCDAITDVEGVIGS